jgi:hypothetical protein
MLRSRLPLYTITYPEISGERSAADHRAAAVPLGDNAGDTDGVLSAESAHAFTSAAWRMLREMPFNEGTAYRRGILVPAGALPLTICAGPAPPISMSSLRGGETILFLEPLLQPIEYRVARPLCDQTLP